MAGAKGRSGRNRKPAAVRRAEGNRSRRAIPNEPVAQGIPIAPDYFDGPQLEIFEAALIAAPQGALAACDSFIFEAMIFNLWLMRDSAQKLLEIGTIVRTKDGPARNPLLLIMRGAFADFKTAAAECGFTPAARAKLVADVVPPFEPTAYLLGDEEMPDWPDGFGMDEDEDTVRGPKH